ncbi:MAG: fused response regulator/phosphatase [Filimonas sp.]|nr:fused response regulator/phosphatase [Filimonas sp.]
MPVSSKKIMIVDDSPMMLALMKTGFENEGFTCVAVASATQALRLLDEDMPDIILSDYEMPGMNGFTFRQEVMSKEGTKDIPFVFLTSHSGSDLVTRGLDELMAVDFINKETAIPVVVSKLKNLLTTVRKKEELSLIELRKAAEAINVKSVPQNKPVMKGVEIDFWHKAYQNYPGGDFIDFIQLDDRYLFLVLGDVMGKKWKAWFFSFGFLSYIRAAVRFCVYDDEVSPARILEKINDCVCKDAVLDDVLSGLSLVAIDQQTGKLMYAGAGDLPLLHYKAADKSIHELQTAGLLLGMFDGVTYEEREIEMKTGDRLLLFTDGMTDYIDGVAGRKKTAYEEFKEYMLHQLRENKSNEALITHLSLLLSDDRQADDSSIIFVEKK